MRIGLLPLHQIPGLHVGLLPRVIKGANALLLLYLGHSPRGRNLAPPLFLLVALHGMLPLLPPPPRDLRSGQFRSLSSPASGLYDHLMITQEKEGASSRAAEILKGTLTSGD
ncbi:UNVERIFIED_CONTAM: hypothetical protein Slati_2672300 [Sesamum latifolium]|uniref:Uncharacterized protein n=1 Tax=Sesamum latifolium TaxID=2727402 RepID=A0AAW2VZB1_9LAMI